MSIISMLQLAGVEHQPKSKRLIESLILVEGYKEAQEEFASVAGDEQAASTIETYRNLVSRNQVEGNERNIDFWRKQGWEKFRYFVDGKSQQKSIRQEKESMSEGKSVVLQETDQWLVVVPLDKDASCFHGKNTDWCTTKPFQTHFEKYFYQMDIILIYFLKKGTGDKWAVATYKKTRPLGEYFDKNDNKITRLAFIQQTGLNPDSYMNLAAHSMIDDQRQEARRTYKAAVDYLERSPLDRVDPKVEQLLMIVKDPRAVVRYCINVKGRWPQAERFLANTEEIGVYVNRVLDGERVKVIENAVGTPDAAYTYATQVIKGRWPEKEPLILKDLLWATKYAKDVVKTRWPELEERLIASDDPKGLVNYARWFIKGRWPEAEAVIKTDKAAFNMYKRDMAKLGVTDY